MTKQIEEIWKPIPWANGDYSVSSLGRIRGEERIILRNGKPVRLKRKILRPFNRWLGYMAIHLKVGHQKKMFSVHRLVLEAFIGHCPPNMECCHNNGKPSDNRLDNLRWDTKKANQADRKLHGTNRLPRREGGPGKAQKLTDEQVREIRKLYFRYNKLSLSKKYGVHRTTIWAICHGKKRKYVTEATT